MIDKPHYQCLILEDNLEITPGMSKDVLDSVRFFLSNRSSESKDWDVFHLAYMVIMYTLLYPSTTSDFNQNLRLHRLLSFF